MASLIEDLLETLSKEKDGYERLYNLSLEKRNAIVDRDVSVLENVSDREQDISTDLRNLEKRRLRLIKDMAVVLGHDNEELTVTRIIELLSKQPKEQKQLTEARDLLVDSAGRMQFMNEQNRMLLEQAMDMLEFDLNLFKGMRQAPETANYNRNAYNTGDLLPDGGFDAKQ